MKRISIDILLALTLALFILSFAAVFALLFRPLYYMDMDLLQIPQTSGYAPTLIKENYDALITYNSLWNTDPLTLNGLAMSPEGRIHFQEVRAIFVGLQVLLLVSGLGLLVGLLCKIRRRDLRFLKWGALLCTVLPLFVGLIIATNWQWFFVAFHKLVFPNDYWIFDPLRDPIITILPDAFFMHCALLILGLVLLLCLISLLVWHFFSKKKPHYLRLEALLPVDSAVVPPGEMIGVVRSSMRIIDPRLLEHGERVAFLIYAILEHGDKLKNYDMAKLCILSLFHDIGSQKVDEINEMTVQETEEIMLHSIYGYTFLKHFSPLGTDADAILYHHMRWENLQKTTCSCPDYAQLIFLADRIDVEIRTTGTVDATRLQGEAGTRFKKEFVALFLSANQNNHLVTQCTDGSYKAAMEVNLAALQFTPAEVLDYLKTLIFMIDFVSADTMVHSVHVTALSVALAKRLGFSSVALETIAYGAFLHDIGKISMSPALLEPQVVLSPAQRTQLRAHVTATNEILQGVVSDPVRLIAARHHERLDGSGYPNGLSGNALNKPQRIVATANVLSGLMGAKSHTQAMSKAEITEALGEMMTKRLLDPQTCVEALDAYDSLLEATQKAQAPVLATYGEMQAEYQALVKRYRRPKQGA